MSLGGAVLACGNDESDPGASGGEAGEASTAEAGSGGGSTGEAGTSSSSTGGAEDNSGGSSNEGGSGNEPTATAGSAGQAASPSVTGACVASEFAGGDNRVGAPNPWVSLEKPVGASEIVTYPEGLVDGVYLQPNWDANFGLPTPEAPVWAAIEIGEGPTSLFIVWKDVNNQPPLSYRLETSADTTDGSDGTWEVALEITDNTEHIREHVVPFDGMSWLKLVVTSAPEGASAVRFDELAAFDISELGDGLPGDTWYFLGDSITAGAFSSSIGRNYLFNVLIAENHEGYGPAFINGGIGGEFTQGGLNRIEEVLELYPHFKYFPIGYGTNDSWGNKDVVAVGFEQTMRTLVETILDAGRVPILARIPYASDGQHQTVPDFNTAIDELQAEYGLPCGPDLYGWFKEHPDQLSNDGVHPAPAGYREMNRLWAEAVAALYTAG